MFYSHNLLARKSPLGTVWVAAHLQNQLKKKNYTEVNISSTAEQIMNPEVPIALRLSGFLLFGIVRIYSKKVEYLQQDCNALRIEISKVYANVDINLSEDANKAKYESITLPDNFALDLITIDEHNLNGSPDSHLRPNEDISITDYSPASFLKNRLETPAGYILFKVGEDASQNPSISEASPGPRSVRVDETSEPRTPPSKIQAVQDPNHHLESNNDTIMNDDDVAPFENLRISTPILQKSPLVAILPDMVEPDLVLVNEISKSNNNDVTNINDIPDNGGPSSPPKQISQESVHTEHDNDHVQDSSGPQVSFELAPSLQKAERPSEPAQSSQRAKRPLEQAPPSSRVKRRRIKYDQATVLSNEFMKNAIDDAKGLKRKRKAISSCLDVYRLNNAHKKEKVLFDPIITGLCEDLSQMHEDGYISSKASLINVEQANPNFNVEQVNPDFNVEQENPDAMEIGRDRDIDDHVNHSTIPISSPDTRFSSPPPVDENTPAFSTDVWSKSYQADTTIGTKTSVASTPDPASSVSTFNMSDTETPVSQSQHGVDNSGRLYDIPEVDEIDLAVMEDDGGTPSLMGTPETGSLLPRTRSVAKLIKEKSAATPSTSENLGSVSMKSILEGKTKKVCSRMFFETLVLKSCDFVDVKQDTPYGDITLKVTPKLLKLDFSN
ncbi:sister chromatid cohesion 1 protein 3-like [Bidens hawaiensis]|uniref:sister chromatid cohesion 1 protein 3-like n=1 Tax=Bidens hawaiensis TaxID=980011 RepID=UPI00404A985B